MSMFDTGSVELILPNGDKFDMNNMELQTHVSCFGLHFHVTNVGTQGYSGKSQFSPFSTFRNTHIQFSIAKFGVISNEEFRVYFNKYGVVYKVAFVEFNNYLEKWVESKRYTVNWPKHQVSKYNRAAIIEMLKIMPSRFKKGVSVWTRMRVAFNFLALFPIMDKITYVKNKCRRK